MDIHVTIKEDGETDKEITLKEIDPGVYKLDHPLADPDRVFLRNGSTNVDMAMYALMHLGLRRR